MAEHVILFAGPMGAGKSTGIATLSDIPVVSTEAENNDREQADKATTTVALDYGEITLGDDDKVRMYGVPGQRRFDFMWSILAERAMGLLLLIHADAASPCDEVRDQLTAFSDLIHRGGLVIGVSRTDVGPAGIIDDVTAVAAAHLPHRPVPVLALDTRDPLQMRMMLMTLIVDVETRALFRGTPL